MIFARCCDFVIDLIFPIHCVSCRREGEWFCSGCATKVTLNQKQFCPVCWQPSSGGKTCETCRGISPLAGLRVAASYAENPTLAAAVKTLKYKFSQPLARNLAEILTRAITQKNYAEERIITAIPLHTKRLRYRGFNQAELLAREVASNLQLPYENLLIRSRNTLQQAKLSREKRLQNLRDAFSLASPISLQNKTVILVDDIASTATTLSEAAKVLRAAGAKEVWGLVIARG
ncbi:MAG: ComF family protein [Candidatus Gracilibacteria bacterium]|nr:ComF family protein [Candidatus Gracilibacteria bacterium]MDD5179427.1 ComF family protein [Candidatus Gracilibacteria bacterium]